MSTLWLMRHAQTLFNVRHKIQGWCDAPLTELGIQQAKNARDYFRQHGITFDHAYSSTSERACDTLELVTDLPYTRVKGLKEWNFGIFEGESEDLNPPLPYGDFFKGFGGEGEMEVSQRMADTLCEIMSRDGHESVLAVSHGGASAVFMRRWPKHPDAVMLKTRSNNCSVLRFEYRDGAFCLMEVIDTQPQP